MADVVLSVLAHPDDAEFLCAGAMIRLVREQGWVAKVASLTAGDCGSTERGPQEIAAIRREEARRAADLVGAEYQCLGERDLLVFYNETALEKVTRLLRETRPTIVLTHSPRDYMLDHEMASCLARAAAFAAPAPNFLCDRGHPPPLPRIPHVYYCDPIEGKDLFGQEIPAGFCVDISGVMELKTLMLTCHASQREWLRKHHGMDHYLEAMHAWSRERAKPYGATFAEGFRQHLGHGYPREPLLQELLGVLR